MNQLLPSSGAEREWGSMFAVDTCSLGPCSRWFASRLFFSRGDAGNLSSRRAFVPGAPCPNLGNARLFCALSHGRLPSHSPLLSCAGSTGAGATALTPCSETIHWDWTRSVSSIGPWQSKELILFPRVHVHNYRTQYVAEQESLKYVAIQPGIIILARAFPLPKVVAEL